MQDIMDYCRELSSAKEIYEYIQSDYPDKIELLESIKQTVQAERLYGNMKESCLEKMEEFINQVDNSDSIKKLDELSEDSMDKNIDKNQGSNQNLVHCTACGQLISKEAMTCPGCGHPTEYSRLKDAEQQEKWQKEQTEKAQNMGNAIVGFLIVGVMIVGLIMWLGALKTISQDMNSWPYYTYRAPLTNHEAGVISRLVMGIGFNIVGFIGSYKLRKSQR